MKCLLPFELGGVEFSIAPHGFGRHRFCLAHGNGVVGITPSTRLPTFRVQPRAEFLHGVGPTDAVAWFRQLVERECGHVALTVSRIDLCCDLEGFTLLGEDRHRFVCRASSCRTNEDAGVLTGFEFGRRTSKSICARIYDKTAEIVHSGHGYVTELWGDRHVDGAQVWRVEFEIGRRALRKFDVHSPEQAIACAGALWSYCASEWLSFRLVTPDQTKARWPVDPAWTVVRDARVANGAKGAERLRAATKAALLEALLPGLLGYLSSFAALLGTTGIVETCGALARVLVHRERSDLGLSRPSFSERVALKLRRAALT